MSTATEGGGAPDDFGALAAPFRRELVAYGYRMLGSVDDAEEIVQDVYLDAWRAFRVSKAAPPCGRGYIGSLPVLSSRRQRVASVVHCPRSWPARPWSGRRFGGIGSLAWLQPAPDSLLARTLNDPATVVAARDTMRLAFVAALQILPPRQRAVLILRDVLQWRAAEVGALLDLSVAAVNSALQRAHARLPADHDTVTEPSEPRQRELLDRYVAAFENADVDTLVSVLTEDAMFEMPPFTPGFVAAGSSAPSWERAWRSWETLW